MLERLHALFEKVFFEPHRRVEREAFDALSHRAAQNNPSEFAQFDRKVMIVFVVVAVCLTLQDYFGMTNRYVGVVEILNSLGLNSAAAALRRFVATSQINGLTYWTAWCVTAYFVIPAAVIKLVFRERLRDYGLGLGGALKDAWIYVLFFIVMVPLVFLVSKNQHFLETYPFYDARPGEPLWPNIIRWELMYSVQFFALEFFFRGFFIHGLRHRFGFYSVFAMMVPYCMIHYGKPLPETIGAIVAGVVLGSLSLKTRSIWLGVAIHVSVAMTMDFTSLWRKGFFG